MIMKSLFAVLAAPVLLTHALSIRWGGGGGKTNDTGPSNTTTVNDTAILNYALAIENLQSAFYNQSLSQFDEQAFNDSGFSPSVRTGFVNIGQNKQIHAALINNTLGSNATQPCNYSFPVTNVTSFTALSQLIENIGVSAYIGVMQNITNTTFITVASSILATDARYASWVASVNGVEPWDGAFDVPLSPRQVITLAAPYVTSCPPSNITQPFTPFPSLVISPGTAGSNVTFSFTSPTPSNDSTTNATLFGAFFQELTPVFVPLSTDDNSVTVPSNLTGLVYVAVTNSSSTVSDDTIVAGPTVLNLTRPVEGTIGNGTVPAPVPVPETTTEATSATETSATETATETATTAETTPPPETTTATETTATSEFTDTATDTATPTEETTPTEESTPTETETQTETTPTEEATPTATETVTA
ncbi:Protein rds1 [Hypsizygus marmoreus]|uniref:Protein rds1 n=1 Tax=Hypsizygus marmoreus TaxID=39966 RepID=A0A369KBW1_HYPMA|nr:Protein rds1 [Hypsizygus marmoreus]